MTESQAPGLLPAAAAMIKLLSALPEQELAGLQIGGLSLEQAYTRLLEALEQEQRTPSILKRYADALMENGRIGGMNADLQMNLIIAQDTILALRQEIERQRDLIEHQADQLTLAEEQNAILRGKYPDPPF